MQGTLRGGNRKVYYLYSEDYPLLNNDAISDAMVVIKKIIPTSY